MAPLDLGPTLLASTQHRAITGPYHRDPAALEAVLRFFTAEEADAHAVARIWRTEYVAFCASDGEMAGMAKFAPKGMAARLLRGERIGWLTSMQLQGTTRLSVFRVSR